MSEEIKGVVVKNGTENVFSENVCVEAHDMKSVCEGIAKIRVAINQALSDVIEEQKINGVAPIEEKGIPDEELMP